MRFEDKLIENLDFGRSRLNSSVFEKLLISNSCISFMKYYALRSFLHKIALFFKNLFFLDFRSIEPVFRSIKIVINIFGLSLLDSIDVRSILDWSQLKNFKFLCFWPKFFFHASFVFRIHMYCIVFVSILQFCSHISQCFHT